MAGGEKKKEIMEIQTFEYLENQKSFFNEIENIVHNYSLLLIIIHCWNLHLFIKGGKGLISGNLLKRYQYSLFHGKNLVLLREVLFKVIVEHCEVNF